MSISRALARRADTEHLDAGKEAPSIHEVAELLMLNPDFVAQLESFLLTAIDGQARWYPEAATTFAQMTKCMGQKAQDSLERGE